MPLYRVLDEESGGLVDSIDAVDSLAAWQQFYRVYATDTRPLALYLKVPRVSKKDVQAIKPHVGSASRKA